MKLSKAEHLQKAANLRKLAEEQPNAAEKRNTLRAAKMFELLAQSKLHPENQPEMTARKPLSLEEAMKDAPQMSGQRSSPEAQQAVAAALLKQSDPQAQAAGAWLSGKAAAEVKARYAGEIEAAIAKAKSWREVVTVIADDGAEAYAYRKQQGHIAWGVNAPETSVNILRGVRLPDGSDEAEG